MIFCCGALHEPDYVYFLEANESFKNRKLEILLACPSKNSNCNAFIAELSETNIYTGFTKCFRVKNKKAEKFVEKILKQEKTQQFKIQIGSKNNMNWVYGENKELKNRSGIVVGVAQKAVDFNNKKKLLNISIFLLITYLHNKYCEYLHLLCSFFINFKKCAS